MTTAAASGNGDLEGKPIRIWMAHHRMYVYVIGIMSAYALGMVRYYLPEARTGTFVVSAAINAVLAWFIFFVARVHDRRPCPPCAARIPSDGAAVVERYHMRKFRALHWVLDGKKIGRLPLRMVAILAAGAVVGIPAEVSPWARMAYGALVCLGMGWILNAHDRHTLLAPWCPWCQGGGEGKSAPETAPPPVRHAS